MLVVETNSKGGGGGGGGGRGDESGIKYYIIQPPLVAT